MLNPVLSNFKIILNGFFHDDVTKQYNDFLLTKNAPIKSIEEYIYESIQNISMPGLNLNLNTVSALGNLGKDGTTKNFAETSINRHFPGTVSLNEVVDTTSVNVTFRNTILNWMYMYQTMFLYYKRKRTLDDFQIILTMMDSAEIEMIRFKLSDCFISTMPGLEFSYNQSMSDSKTFECGFTFNKFDVEFIIPNFNISKFEL